MHCLQAFFRWWTTHVGKIDNATASKNAPIADQLAEACRRKGPCTRCPTASQLWSKDNFGSLRDKFQAWFTSLGLSEGARASECSWWTAKCFDSLPAEDQESYKTKALQMKADAAAQHKGKGKEKEEGENNEDSDEDDTQLGSVEKVGETPKMKARQSALVGEKVLTPAETDQ